MLGERLSVLRRGKKMKQKELADILGLQESAISLYETNRSDPSDKVKVDIAKHFDVSLDYLLGVIDECVPYYNSEKFMAFPTDMTIDEKMLLLQFRDFIEFKRGNE